MGISSTSGEGSEGCITTLTMIVRSVSRAEAAKLVYPMTIHVDEDTVRCWSQYIPR